MTAIVVMTQHIAMFFVNAFLLNALVNVRRRHEMIFFNISETTEASNSTI